ncbi:MAG: Hint domain-containing protein [Pseudomonadota bacterium]
MTISPNLPRGAAGSISPRSLLADPTRRPPHVQLRRYEVAALDREGNIVETRHVAPAISLFEGAFCAFARGSVVETDSGPMAIEDLMPGDRLPTVDGPSLPVTWIGRTVVNPGQNRGTRRLPLTRIMSESLGPARPASCLIAGPAARVLATPYHLRALSGGAPMLTPVAEFVDGVNIIETAPPSPIELFHLCLSQHAVIRVGGIEFETYHPGPNASRITSHQMRDLFLEMFPRISYFSEFGAVAHPRAGDGPVHAKGA